MGEPRAPKAVEGIKFWAALAFAVAAAGFGAATYFGRFASAEELDALGKKVSADEVQAARVEEDVHYFSDQLREIGKAVGAPLLPVPFHRSTP